MINLKYILMIFEKISGLKVNYCKSSLAGVGIGVNEARGYAQLLGCEVED